MGASILARALPSRSAPRASLLGLSLAAPRPPARASFGRGDALSGQQGGRQRSLAEMPARKQQPNHALTLSLLALLPLQGAHPQGSSRRPRRQLSPAGHTNKIFVCCAAAAI